MWHTDYLYYSMSMAADSSYLDTSREPCEPWILTLREVGSGMLEAFAAHKRWKLTCDHLSIGRPMQTRGEENKSIEGQVRRGKIFCCWFWKGQRSREECVTDSEYYNENKCEHSLCRPTSNIMNIFMEVFESKIVNTLNFMNIIANITGLQSLHCNEAWESKAKL